MAHEAIPAATLILVRERAKGPPELLMVTRSRAMAFAPGALVFPGGRIDPGDVAMAASLGLEDGAAAVAAIRETIEECAVGVGIDPVPDSAQVLELQEALVAGADFAALLASHTLALSTAPLKPFARWVPGHEVSRRFDTLFFIARASEVEFALSPGSGECESAQWLSAQDALGQERRGAARLIYPTRKNLERLAQFDSFAAILADAERHPVLPITAWVEQGANGETVRIPPGLGYPITSDPLDEVWRG